LELGGSDPFIVMPSADIENAAESAITARMINNGQSCIAAKRFIVHRDVAGTFLDAFTDRLEAIRVGDPFDEDTELGPLATDAIRREVIEQVRRSVDAGARVIAGGEIPEHSANSGGYYYAPLALGEIPDGTPAANDEIFGPVASVFVVDSLDQAIERANRTDFGLGASVWTQVAGEADLLVREIESGSVFVNRIVASDPRLPFGGVKSSGYGRELGPHGIREFVNAKTVVRA
jgi:succinate-semialdehyde dehydrogenase/glutarate-semialdehyde dehydrogenase